MCGLVGAWDTARRYGGREALRASVAAMADTLRHRGPDDAGVWCDEGIGLALGHRRLSIVDLSPQGHQPMRSRSGRYVVTFNGEIYNFGELRADLGDCGWRGHSDTEVMLAAFEAWGVAGAVEKFSGMFAFAVWDGATHELTLCRDRLGEKPLYFGWQGNTLLFGSELKALRAFPDFRPELDRESVALLLRHNCIPAPRTIYRGFHKLEPGTLRVFPAGGPGRERSIRYWFPQDAALAGVAARAEGKVDFAQAADELEALLRRSIGRQMVADVPLGAFLSGGLDSSTIVALMQAQSSRPIKTFTIGFEEEAYSEAEHAWAVAKHLGTDHTELFVTAADALAVVPRLPVLYDEPFADASQVPTFLVSQLASRYVKVALSGDGGDELFGGYNRHFLGPRIWRTANSFPRMARILLGRILLGTSPEALDRAFGFAMPFMPRRLRYGNVGERLHKLAEACLARSPYALYRRLVSHWEDPGGIVLGVEEPRTLLDDAETWQGFGDFAEWMMCVDQITYLPDDILVKVDRAAMANSLESRVPFLDHAVIEWAWRLPIANKISKGVGKQVLREVLYRHVPRELVDRPKAGFGVPIDAWLRGPARDWAEALLDESRLRREAVFDPAPIRKRWHEHLSGERNWQYQLWDVLMFQAWQEHWRA